MAFDDGMDELKDEMKELKGREAAIHQKRLNKAFDDREYTMEAIVQEANLIERHFRDGSWKQCTCNPSKHLPTISGLASEGIGFTDDAAEKEFMMKTRDRANQLRAQLKTRVFDEQDADDARAWAREIRRRIELNNFDGELPKTASVRHENHNTDETIHVAIGEMPDEECQTCKPIMQQVRELTGVQEKQRNPDYYTPKLNPLIRSKSTIDTTMSVEDGPIIGKGIYNRFFNKYGMLRGR